METITLGETTYALLAIDSEVTTLYWQDTLGIASGEKVYDFMVLPEKIGFLQEWQQYDNLIVLWQVRIADNIDDDTHYAKPPLTHASIVRRGSIALVRINEDIRSKPTTPFYLHMRIKREYDVTDAYHRLRKLSLLIS